MANIAVALRTEIARLARREARELVEPTRKAASAARRDIAALKRRLEVLERALSAARKQNGRLKETSDGGVSMRFRAQGVKAHRQRLSLSAEDFGRLLGVSSQTIYNWEQGKGRPSKAKLADLSKVRALGKRAVVAKLQAMASSSS